MSARRRSPRLALVLAGAVGSVSAAGTSACDAAGTDRPRPPSLGGDPRRGESIIESAGCGACHTIPGIRSAHGTVAAPLTLFARRTYIAGGLPNTPTNLQRWLLEPAAVVPNTAMPKLLWDLQAARDVAAYLYTLE